MTDTCRVLQSAVFGVWGQTPVAENIDYTVAAPADHWIKPQLQLVLEACNISSNSPGRQKNKKLSLFPQTNVT